MGLYSNYPIALAPGLGILSYFSYSMCSVMKWEQALGAVFVSGMLFFIFTITKASKKIVESIPKVLRHSVVAGIGLFITFIGFQISGIVSSHEKTLVTLGNFKEPKTVLALIGLLVISALLTKKIKVV